MKQRRIWSLLLALLFVLAPMLQVFAAEQELTFRRIAGENRYETAVTLSQETYRTADNVVIVSGEDWPDALIGGRFAVHVEGPLLLSKKESISKDTIEEIKRLEAKQVYVLGGNATISDEIMNDLKKYNPIRLSGKDRIETASVVNQWIIDDFNSRSPVPPFQSFYVSSHTFADALSATPVLLQYGNGVGLLQLIDKEFPNPPYSDVKIGGNADEFANHIAGEDRYETSAKLYGQGVKGYESIVIVNGDDYPDGLASTPFAIQKNASILITKKDVLPESIRKVLIDEANSEYSTRKSIFFVGGENSISEKIMHQIADIFKE